MNLYKGFLKNMLLKNIHKSDGEGAYDKSLWVDPGVVLSVPNIYLEVLFRHEQLIKGLEDINIFVETGTECGGTANIMAKHFKKVYTIEIFTREDNPNTNVAINDPKNKHVDWLIGDSTKILKQLVEVIDDQRCIFFLDAHSGHSSSLRGELKVIKKFKNKNSVIMIDDAIDIGRLPFYPTLPEFKKLIHDINPKYNILFTNLGRGICLVY